MRKTHSKAHRKPHSKTRRARTRRVRRRGGYTPLSPAPYDSHLYGSSPSRMSLAQGEDFASYHVAQHGGVADYSRAFDVLSDGNMIESSMSHGPLQAIADVRGLKDDQPTPLGPTVASPGLANGGPSEPCGSKMTGGRRRRRTSKKSKKNAKKSKKSKKSKKVRRRRQGGGSLGYAPVTAPGLLLDNNRAYTQAGLNPEYYQSSSTEQLLADMRDRA